MNQKPANPADGLKGFTEGGQASAQTLQAMMKAAFGSMGRNGIETRWENGRLVITGANVEEQPGFIRDYAGIIDGTDAHPVPRGYLKCDGAAVSRTTYARLFAVTGTTYGTGDGSTTFNVPDCKQRVTVGVGDAGGTVSAYALGDKVGYNKHGITENNHHNHIFELGLNHSHVTATEVGIYPGSGVYGTTTSPTELANFDTVAGGESSDAIDSDEGSIVRSSSSGTLKDVAIITLKHLGDDGNPTPGAGATLDDTDNRQPSIAFWKLIKT